MTDPLIHAASSVATETTQPLKILASVAAVVAGLPCVGAAQASAVPTLSLQVAEWNIVPSEGLVPAGHVKLAVTNYGTITHELEIVRTARWGERLPTRKGRVTMKSIVTPIFVKPGQTRTGSVTMTPGSYVLLDNLPGHYALGTS